MHSIGLKNLQRFWKLLVLTTGAVLMHGFNLQIFSIDLYYWILFLYIITL